ncbi:MAG: hypothetical protein L0J45_02165 [Psychroflexus sp.]|nr:hypothetical protein [Psychroflexus sp.]MDN6309681.1 hypothetical protein [Psychroflexus sp.]
MKKNKKFKNVVAIILVIFALITIFMSSSVLFDWFGIRAKQGSYAPFILKTNLTAGLLYLLAAYGYLKSQKWPFWVMLSVALLMFYSTALLYLHSQTVKLYENRILTTMIFRILFTIIIAGLMYKSSSKKIDS